MFRLFLTTAALALSMAVPAIAAPHDYDGPEPLSAAVAASALQKSPIFPTYKDGQPFYGAITTPDGGTYQTETLGTIHYPEANWPEGDRWGHKPAHNATQITVNDFGRKLYCYVVVVNSIVALPVCLNKQHSYHRSALPVTYGPRFAYSGNSGAGSVWVRGHYRSRPSR